MHTFLEFFAGGGMARAGFGPNWQCVFANDFDPKKAASYAQNWGGSELLVGDVAAISVAELPGRADLAWASFPCQDLSLAGIGAGLQGARSGTFWPFWRLIEQLNEEERAPRLIVLENVCGALTSHGGKDFANICGALSDAGYGFGALVIDAVRFVPQSRPRLFIVGVKNDNALSLGLTTAGPNPTWHSPALVQAYKKLPDRLKAAWQWWTLPVPAERTATFADLVGACPVGVKWHSQQETDRLLSLMNDVHLAKVEAARSSGQRQVGALYKRTRPDGKGGRVQRAEVRFDGIAGCLRTPTGGSSRQFVLIVDQDQIRSRLLSPREAARLMGLPDSYQLPEQYNDAYHLAGDGLVVPVVRFLSENLLEPLLAAQTTVPVAPPASAVVDSVSVFMAESRRRRLSVLEHVGD